MAKTPSIEARSRFSGNLEVAEMLAAIYRQATLYPAVWHPLGFLDIEVEVGSVATKRLHVWSTHAGDYRSSGWDIHLHDWDLRSHVLCGTLEHQKVKVRRSTVPSHSVYVVEYDGPSNYLRRTPEQVFASVIHTEFIAAGSTYSLPAGVYHRVVADRRGPTATLVESVRVPGVSTRVLGDVHGEDTIRTERPSCSLTSVRRIVYLVMVATGATDESGASVS